jgi:ATP-binding cassette, subfamily B, bacterial
LPFRRARDDNRSALTGDRLLVATMRCASRWLVPLVVLAVVGAVATLALPAVLGRALDEIVASASAGGSHGGGGGGQGTDGWLAVGGPVLVTAALVGLIVVVDVVAQLVAGAATAESTGLLRREVARHVLDAGPAVAGGSAEGDLVARLVANTTTAGKAVVVVSGLAASTLPPVGAVVALGLIDPWLALTFAVGMLSASGAVRAYLRDSRKATAGYLAAQGAIATRLVDALAGARSIAAARTTEREVGRVLAPLDEVRRHGTAVWRNIARLAFQGEPVVLLTQAAVIAVAGMGVASGRLTPGEMLAASRYAVMAAGIGGILDELASLTRARAASDRIVELIETPIVRHGLRSLPSGCGALELRGVRAAVDGHEVLRGLDLLVPGGRTVALVGRSGSGKSLVAALAGRLTDPDAGEVLLDGVPLRSLDRRALRRAVTYAFERPDLIGRTVADAIAFGVDRPSPARLRAAADAARAEPFIARLPSGYDAVLADTPLSGGEIQRLGLARALAHDARLVILDDATSSLDTATEAQIAAALTTAARGRTRLIVTHRLATTARADVVAWLDEGVVRAMAPHHVLWRDLAYRAIFRAAHEADEVLPIEPALPSPTAPVLWAELGLVPTPVPLPPPFDEVPWPELGAVPVGPAAAVAQDHTPSGGPGLRPEPDDERDGEPAPTPAAPLGVPDIPCDDEVAASAVAATGNDPLDPVDVRTGVPLAARSTR